MVEIVNKTATQSLISCATIDDSDDRNDYHNPGQMHPIDQPRLWSYVDSVRFSGHDFNRSSRVHVTVASGS